MKLNYPKSNEEHNIGESLHPLAMRDISASLTMSSSDRPLIFACQGRSFNGCNTSWSKPRRALGPALCPNS